MIVILTGSVGSGKTSFLRRLLSYLGSEGIVVAGFIGQRVFVEDELVGYDLIDAATLHRHSFLRQGEGPADKMVGPYRIDPAGKEAAASILRDSPASALLVVDELGPLELAGEGHWPALKPLLEDPARHFLFVIRDTCLDDFAKVFEGRPTATFSVRDRISSAEVVREIQCHVRPC